MRLLILGYSSIAQRRVIPAAAKVAAIDEISIASKSRAARRARAGRNADAFLPITTPRLRESGSDLVYVSLPNAMHERWVLAALAAGKHVIVDKPAMITLRGVRTRRQRSAARRASVSPRPPCSAITRISRRCRALSPKTARSRWSTPSSSSHPCRSPIFAITPSLGGGCLLDMGPYAAALMRILGGGAPSQCRGIGGQPASRNRRRHGFLGAGAAGQWRQSFPAISASRANIKIACSLWRVQAL